MGRQGKTGEKFLFFQFCKGLNCEKVNFFFYTYTHILHLTINLMKIDVTKVNKGNCGLYIFFFADKKVYLLYYYDAIFDGN